jgi:hypothetical protein
MIGRTQEETESAVGFGRFIRVWQAWSRFTGFENEIFPALRGLFSPAWDLQPIRFPTFSTFENKVWDRLMCQLRHFSTADLPQQWNYCPRHGLAENEFSKEETVKELLLFHALVNHDEVYDDLHEEGEQLRKGEAKNFVSSLISCLAGVALCTTASGKICLTNHSPKVGDVVVRFENAGLPYILRKLESQEAHNLVGYCYIDGLEVQPFELNRDLVSTTYTLV